MYCAVWGGALLVRVFVMPRSKVPHARSASPTAQSAFLDTVLSFVKWSQGRADLATTLECLALHVGAEAASLSRWERAKDTSRIAGVFDQGHDPLTPALSRSFAKPMFRDFIDSVKPGTAVLLSDALDNRGPSDPNLEAWMFKRGVVEIASICVNAGNGVRDIIEFHFTKPLPKQWEQDQEAFSAMLFNVFQGRQRGLMIQALLRTASANRQNRPCIDESDLLSPENPAQLTRSEWRVCALIANGLSRDGVAKELAVKPGTLRTHMRNIYAKTGYERFHELALRLVSPREQRNLGMVEQGQAA